jgi:DNA ligase (NAD+)
MDSAINLRYEHGVLVQRSYPGRWRVPARTSRHNVRTLRRIPLASAGRAAPAVLEVRGEIYMRRDDFEASQCAAQRGSRARRCSSIRAMPRPVAVRQLDPAHHGTRVRPLSFFAYGHGGGSRAWAHAGHPFRGCWIALAAFGLPGVRAPLWYADGPEGLMRLFHAGDGRVLRESACPYDIDGVVYKVDRLASAARLSVSSPGSPAGRWPTSIPPRR